jgi:hypothetical protein
MKLAGGLLALVVKYLYIAQLKKRLGVHGIPVSSATLTSPDYPYLTGLRIIKGRPFEVGFEWTKRLVES